jgi:acetolactate synthase-1/2/3 large subunit
LVSINARPITAYEADLELVGDARTVIDDLLLRLPAREPWADSPFRLRTRVRNRLAADPRTHAGVELVSAVEQGWPSDANIVCDMSVGGYWVGGYVVRSRPRRLQYPIGWGTLGYGLPASIGAATDGVPTLAVVGDGGIAMGFGELATLAQEQLPVTVLIVDDGGYGMLRYGREGRSEGTELLGPEWNALASAFHLSIQVVTGANGLREAISDAAVAGGPRLVVWASTLFPPMTTSPRWNEPV